MLLPAAQGVQTLAPVVENRPAGHTLHKVLAAFGTVPASQMVQAAVPAAVAT